MNAKTQATINMALDPRVVTLPNIARLARAYRTAQREWEQGRAHSPSTDDLMLDGLEALDQVAWMPWDARPLASEAMYDAQCRGERNAELALMQLVWMVQR